MQPFSQKAGWRSYETRGQPIQAQGQEITPIERVAQFRWPGGAMIWHRPVAVEVRRPGGIARLPIPNTTRRIIALYLVGLALGVLALSLMQRRSGPQVSKRRRRRSR